MLNTYEIYDTSEDVLQNELFSLEDRLAAGAYRDDAEAKRMSYLRDMIQEELAERRQALSVFDLLKDEFALEMGLSLAGEEEGGTEGAPETALTQQEWARLAGLPAPSSAPAAPLPPKPVSPLPPTPPSAASEPTRTSDAVLPQSEASVSTVAATEGETEEGTGAEAKESPKKASSHLKSLSVYEAAMAMFKEEKRKVSKAKKAQLTEGWGFKAQPQQTAAQLRAAAAQKRAQLPSVTVGPSSAPPLPSKAPSVKKPAAPPAPTVKAPSPVVRAPSVKATAAVSKPAAPTAAKAPSIPASHPKASSVPAAADERSASTTSTSGRAPAAATEAPRDATPPPLQPKKMASTPNVPSPSKPPAPTKAPALAPPVTKQTSAKPLQPISGASVAATRAHRASASAPETGPSTKPTKPTAGGTTSQSAGPVAPHPPTQTRSAVSVLAQPSEKPSTNNVSDEEIVRDEEMQDVSVVEEEEEQATVGVLSEQAAPEGPSSILDETQDEDEEGDREEIDRSEPVAPFPSQPASYQAPQGQKLPVLASEEEAEEEEEDSDEPVRRSSPTASQAPYQQPSSYLLHEVMEEIGRGENGAAVPSAPAHEPASRQVHADDDEAEEEEEYDDRPVRRPAPSARFPEDEVEEEVGLAGLPVALKISDRGPADELTDRPINGAIGDLSSYGFEGADGMQGWGNAEEQRRQDRELMRALRGQPANEALAQRHVLEPHEQTTAEEDLASLISLHRNRQAVAAIAALEREVEAAPAPKTSRRTVHEEESKGIAAASTSAADGTAYASLFTSILSLFVSGHALEDRLDQAQAFAHRARELAVSYLDRFAIWTRLRERAANAPPASQAASISTLNSEWSLYLKGKSKGQGPVPPLPETGKHVPPPMTRVFKVRTTPDHPEVLEVVREAIRLLEAQSALPSAASSGSAPGKAGHASPAPLWVEDVEPDRFTEWTPQLTDDDVLLTDQGAGVGSKFAYQFLGEETDDPPVGVQHPAFRGALPPISSAMRAQIVAGTYQDGPAPQQPQQPGASSLSPYPPPAMWNLLWSWSSRGVGSLDDLLSFQKVNHYPEARQLTRKDLLAKNLSRLQRKIGFGRGAPPASSPFTVMPLTFLLPQEYDGFAQAFSETSMGSAEPNLWIVKPAALSRGRGIHIVSSLPEVSFQEDQVVQRYIARPMLVHGRKFDLRLYVLVTSFSPLEAFIYRQGFARFSFSQYDTTNVSDLGVHLTNASVQNKRAERLPESILGKGAVEGGSKIPLTRLWELIEEQRLGSRDALWSRIIDTVSVVLLAAQGKIPHQPSSFELFGIDLIIDANAKVWVLEVNASPSMSLDTPLDRMIKPMVVRDTIALLDPLPFDRTALASALHSRASKKQKAFVESLQAKTAEEKNQLGRELHRIFQGARPRQYGEMPQQVGLFERLAPSRRLQNLARQAGAAKGGGAAA